MAQVTFKIDTIRNASQTKAIQLTIQTPDTGFVAMVAVPPDAALAVAAELARQAREAKTGIILPDGPVVAQG